MSGDKKNDSKYLKNMCKAAKRRMKSGYWKEFDNKLKEKASIAESMGENPANVVDFYVNSAIDKINGKGQNDDFYLRVKNMLDEYGEVSDAIGRLIDHDVYDGLSYDAKQKYTLELSNKYVEALEKYRREKAFACVNE